MWSDTHCTRCTKESRKKVLMTLIDSTGMFGSKMLCEECFDDLEKWLKKDAKII